MMAAAPIAPAGAQDGQVEIRIENLRNTRGTIRLCLTRNPAHFPACNEDPAAVKRSVPAAQAAAIRIGGVAPGIWALSVIHDENDNARLDRFMAMPREGFGFSRNPAIRMGPPRFEEVRFQVGGAVVAQVIRMKYLL
jgi:uncharacterized protein (DUF2141 family)